MMATVRHVNSSSGLRKFQTDGFLFVGVYPRVMQCNNTQQYLDPIVVQYKTGVIGRNSAKLEMLTEDEEVGRWKIFGMWE